MMMVQTEQNNSGGPAKAAAPAESISHSTPEKSLLPVSVHTFYDRARTLAMVACSLMPLLQAKELNDADFERECRAINAAIREGKEVISRVLPDLETRLERAEILKKTAADLDQQLSEVKQPPEEGEDEDYYEEDDPRFAEYNDLIERSSTAEGELRELLADPNVRFFCELQKLESSLRENYAEMRRLAENPARIAGLLAEHFGEKAPPLHKARAIIAGPLSISLVYDPADCRPFLDGGRGVHYRDTPINFIQARDGYETTLRHENIHRLQDFMKNEPRFKFENIRRWLAAYTDQPKELSYLNGEMLNLTPEVLLNALQPEIQAQLLNELETRFGPDLDMTVNVLRRIFSTRAATRHFATAGRQAKELDELLTGAADAAERVGDDTMTQHYTGLRDPFQERFAEFQAAAQRLTWVAERLGREAEFSVLSGLHLAKPADWRLVERGLREHCPAVTVNGLTALHGMLFSGGIDLANIPKLVRALPALSDDDREMLNEQCRLTDCPAVYVDKLFKRPDPIAAFHVCCGKLGELMEQAGVGKDGRWAIDITAKGTFYYALLERDAINGYRQLVTRAAQHPEFDSAGFDGALEEYLQQSFLHDAGQRPWSAAELEALPFWPKAVEMELAERFKAELVREG